MACPPEQGCAAGRCVPACDAARANKSTVGCEYYALNPDIISEGAGFCFAAYIVNTWTTPVTIDVQRAGVVYAASDFTRIPKGSGKAITYSPLPNGELPPGEVAVVFLASYGSKLPCPVPAAYQSAEAHVRGTGKGKAFRLRTSAPVTAFDMLPYGGGDAMATSATLLLPTTAWDTNYILVNAYKKSKAVGPAKPSLDIVALEDDTRVILSPVANIEPGGSGVGSASKGVPTQYTLARAGDYLQISQDAELTGSPLLSDKPVGVWAAASCLSVAEDVNACDSAHQQIAPVRLLGNEYVAARYRDRTSATESTPYRLIGVVDGTVLTYEPIAPLNAPKTLALGQIAEITSATPFVVKSQDPAHPFYAAAYMTGGAPLGGVGDPEFVNLVPADQHLDEYTFFTDPTYAETELVVVRPKSTQTVSLDCLGEVGGFSPIGARYEMARVPLVSGDFVPQKGCDNGRHVMKGSGTFGVTVWGWGSPLTGNKGTGGFNTTYVSYAFPAGQRARPINDVVVPPAPR